MKNIKLFSVILLIFAGLLNAQKIGVVDTDYILSKLPQYKEAEARLNSQITSWQTEIQTLQTEFDKKKAALEAEAQTEKAKADAAYEIKQQIQRKSNQDSMTSISRGGMI